MLRDKQAVLQELLVLRCKRGDRQALNELIEQWQERLFYFVRRLVATEEDAWDVLQQTWLRVLRGIHTLKEPGRLPVWLYQIARYAALSHLRTRYRDRSRVEEEGDVTAVAAADESDEFDNWEQVHTCLGQLSLAHREVLTLHFLESFSVEEIAEVVLVPPGTIKSRLHYAKRALRAAIEKEPAHGPSNRQRQEQLLKHQQFNPTLKTRYEQEIQAMLEKKLIGVQRWVWLFPAIGGVAFTLFSAIMAWSMPASFPWLGRLGLAMGVPFGIGWSILGMRVVRRASLNLRSDTGLATGLTWTFLVFLVTIFMVAAPNNIVGLRMILSGLVFLVGGAVFLIRHVIELAELKSREKLLEIELRLAELGEGIKSRSP